MAGRGKSELKPGSVGGEGKMERERLYFSSTEVTVP
jgi:hypothetical protein